MNQPTDSVKPASDSARDALQRIVDSAPKGFFRPGWRRWLLIGGGLLAALAAYLLLLSDSRQASGHYVTEAAVTGNLIVTVSASGSLQPTKSVDVGSELSGTLTSVLVQENDRVSKGQLLAELDPAKLRDAVTRSRAALAAAQAAVAQAQATVAEAKASLARMRQVAKLSGGKVPAKTELEAAEAALQRANANVASARASVVQAEAALKTDETNLGKGTIRSPVDGVVLARKVEPGQSVVAAMTVPVLFTIAEDLTRMELQVKVDEADVGSVTLGQPATFTVAAWPGRDFPATIERVGLGSTITDNVVTYKTVLAVRNDDLALRPGMTATASIVTASRENVLLVPNAALRFTPPRSDASEPRGSFLSMLMPRPPIAPSKRVAAPVAGARRVWVPDGDGVRVVPVRTGVTNGRLTEIVGGDLKAGTAVVTEYRETRG